MRKKFVALLCILTMLLSSTAFAAKKAPLPIDDFLQYCAHGKYSNVKMAIKRNNELDIVHRGFTPLIAAAESQDNPKIINLLVSSGADPNMPNYQGITPLMVAAMRNKKGSITKALLKKGASPYVTDMTGSTATYYAAQSNNVAALSLLISAAPETIDHPNAAGKTPLAAAIKSGASHAQKILLEAGSLE